jgi:hypothetical protein
MRINGNARLLAERVKQDDIGGFARHPRQPEEILHRARDRAVKGSLYHAGRGNDMPCLIAEEPGGSDVLLQRSLLGAGIVPHRTVFPEQLFRDDIDPLIRALCGQHGRHQQFPGGRKPQFDTGRGVLPAQFPDDDRRVLAAR